jgi:hypothetical protein
MWEELRLKVFENRVLRIIGRIEREEIKDPGKKRITMNFIICTCCRTLLRHLNKGG